MRNKNESKRKGKPIEVAVKNKVGELINEPDLEAKGEAERLDRKIQEKAGKARWKSGRVIKKAGRIISGKR
jgi:uncharacterized protein YjbJ (UPF0337 family)